MNNINEWTQDEVKRFWDYESQFKDRYFTFQVGKILVEMFKRNINNKRVLDYGAGAGFFCEHLIESKVASFAAVEYSKESVDLLRVKFKDKENFEGAYEVADLVEKGVVYDTVFLFEVVEHLTDEMLTEVFSNIRKLLKKDGKLIISTPNNEQIEKSFIYCPCCGKIFHRWQHVRSWSDNTLSNFVSNKGFDVEKVCSCNIGESSNIIIKMLRAIKRKVYAKKNVNYYSNLILIAKVKK